MTDFDVIVIGSGIGGGTSARALTEGGARVLLLEAGRQGHRTEGNGLSDDLTDPRARLLRGAWPDPITTVIDGTEGQSYAPLGCGVGGTSVFYAATLERPSRHDIEPTPEAPHPTGGWPVAWHELLPWFDQAQRQFQVHGQPDPLAEDPTPALLPSPSIAAGDQSLMDHLQRNGMHPYRLHSALAYLPGCQECLGCKCPKPCKMDGRSAGVEPALATGRLELRLQARVTRLQAVGAQVTQVQYEHLGQSLTASAKQVVLAAGAYASPALLRASVCEEWPQGLGNRHDLVGRKLMFHLSERFAVWPGKGHDHKASKSIAFRDLYLHKGQRLGMVQSMGIHVGEGEILHFLRLRAKESRLQGRLIHEGLRLPAVLLAKIFGYAKLFDGQMEDLPDPQNRLLFDPARPQQISVHYTTAPEAQARRRLFRRQIRRAFRGKQLMFLSRKALPNLGHPCGTLGMGHDPQTSVTDGFGRVHGVDNLWVADASVFPTSMGVNPSLTIAALAMRQAAQILKEI